MLEQIMKEAETKMDVSVRKCQEELATVRTGRAHTSLLDRISVEAYGSQMPLNQLATVTAPDARLLVVQPYDKSQLAAIEKAIMSSDIGLTPSNDGTVIRLPIPQLTEERRKELIRVVKEMIEHGRVSVRNVRHEVNKRLDHMKKESDVSEDDLKWAHENVQKATDKHIEVLDEMLRHKEAELMEV